MQYKVEQGTYYVRVSRERGNTPYKLNLAVKSSQTDAEPPSPALNNSSFVQRVVDLTNAYRTQAGLQPLKLNAKLSAAAYKHSRDMALNDFFNHTGSDGSRAADRISKQGYNYGNAGENIAAGYTTPETVFQGWMNSPGHRANILYPNVKEIGVGFYFLSNDSGKAPYQYYWTQAFATPAG
ncbi:MAG: CAP domain-containing protein [Leptolyngbyaceae cyanobacterium CRU_2_3]|nr:CAP domain-containing protein [Leptolyngbyaceae cyanobacterium CRU_2_3]